MAGFTVFSSNFTLTLFLSEMEIESLETAAIIDDMTDSIHSDVEDHDVSIAL